VSLNKQYKVSPSPSLKQREKREQEVVGGVMKDSMFLRKKLIENFPPLKVPR
jgi:hypothetical protein